MEIKRGYVKWTDDKGVFHKEPVALHPELFLEKEPSLDLDSEDDRSSS